MTKCIGLLVLACSLWPLPLAASDQAVVLVYHHVSKTTPASTSVTPAEFERHLNYLADNQFNVMSLRRIFEMMDAGEALPEKTVAMTFDDAYASVYSAAWPALAGRGWSFTVFVATDALDRGFSPYMTWAQLAELARAGVDIGNHGAAHEHPHDMTRPAFRADLRQAQQRISAETGVTPSLYAYPYGEYDVDLERIVAEEALYGVGQQSGVATPQNLTSAPRFPISSRYADHESFSLRVHARALRVAVEAPATRLRASGERQPRLVLRSLATSPERIHCFTAAGETLTKDMLGPMRFAVRAPGDIARGRSKYTCTARVDGEASYAWFSHLWIAR